MGATLLTPPPADVAADDRFRIEAYRSDAGTASSNAQVVVAPQLYCNS